MVNQSEKSSPPTPDPITTDDRVAGEGWKARICVEFGFLNESDEDIVFVEKVVEFRSRITDSV